MRGARLAVEVQRWPLARDFRIARGAKREAEVVVATISKDGLAGRAECVPYGRYGETVTGVLGALRAMQEAIGGGLTRQALQAVMPPGAARNALDCALWDLEAKAAGTSVAALVGLSSPHALPTAYTLSLDAPQAMARHALEAKGQPLLKLKLGAEGDHARLEAVRAARPDARLIADANEGWHSDELEALLAACAAADVALVEQPLPAGRDAALAAIARPVLVCADESVHTSADLAELRDRYDAVNIKLDKAGGLTEALAMVREARVVGLKVMVGCMVATSLAMAPAVLLAQTADFVDLDGPLLLARDRASGLRYADGMVHPPTPVLWG